MKQLLILALLTGSFFSIQAQKLQASKVPGMVKASFEKQYPGLTGTWEKEDGNYEVNFKQNGSAMSAIISPSGSILETETDIKVSELLPAISSYIKSHYKNKVIKEAAKIVNADGSLTYEAEVGDADVIFDSAGKFIKEVKKAKGEKEEKD